MPSPAEDEFEAFGATATAAPATAAAPGSRRAAPPAPRPAVGAGAWAAPGAASPTASLGSAAPASALQPTGAPPAAPELHLFVCGWRAGLLLAACFLALGGVAWANPSLDFGSASGPGGGATGAASKSLFFSEPGVAYAAGALSPSGTPTPAPASASRTGTGTPSATRTGTGTPTATTTRSAGASASATPTASATGTGTGTGTPTATGTGTGTATPSSTPTPSNTATLGGGGLTPEQCLARTTVWTNASFSNGCTYDVCCYAFTLEMAHHAPYEACSAKEADRQRHAYAAALVPEDMCYLVMGSSPASAAAARATWGLLASTIWYAVPPESVQPGDAATYPNLLPITGAEGRSPAYTKQNMHALKLVLQDPRSAHCKWLMVASDHTWVNPRNAMGVVRGLPHDGQPMQLGYQWAFMGFVTFITGASGGVALWNRAALDILGPILMDPVKCPLAEDAWVRAPPYGDPAALAHPNNDLMALHACAIRNGITPVNLNQMDASGALALNGVPLEPGPPGATMSWLQADYTRAGHWVSVDNIGDGLILAFWGAFKSLYGPLGMLAGYPAGLLGDIPQPPAAADPAWTADFYSPPPAFTPASMAGGSGGLKDGACAASALSALQAKLSLGRDGAVSGLPLPLELAAELQAAACPADTPHVTVEDICVFVSKEKPNQRSVTAMAVKDLWGWRVAAGGRLFVFGDTADADLGVRTLPGGPYGNTQRSVPILRAMYGTPETAGCKWWAFVHDYDSVNPRAMAAMLRGLRWDVPVVVGYWWHNSVTGPLTTLALGRGLYSRAAIQILAERAATPVCPAGCGGATSSSDDSADLTVCAWRSGIVPLHTFTLDVAGMGIMNDWAFQQEHYLMGWGLLIDQGINPFDASDNAFPFKMALLEQYYQKLYVVSWNVSTPEYYDILHQMYPDCPNGNCPHRLLRGGEAAWSKALTARRLSSTPPDWLMGWK